MKTEDIGGIKVFCDDVHKFGTDAVLLADFAKISSAKYACDMGTGCGIIPLLFCRDSKINITAMDIQSSAISLVEKAVEENQLQGRLEPVLCDIRELDKSRFCKYDLVTMNPPYKKMGAGLMSDNDAVNIARFEVKCTMDDAAKAAASLLMPSGRFCVCHRPERLADIFDSMRKHKIEPKRMRIVCQREGSEPMLVLVEGIRNGNVGMKIMSPLFVENKEGTYSDEMLRIHAPWLEDK
ncbi:MAG: methyltransferase [Clostridia bacterium]|nr:methyltransferase [Clostridia bacterium]